MVRLLFWSDWGEGDGRIQYSTLLGERVKTLVDRDLVEPKGLALDYDSSRYNDIRFSAIATDRVGHRIVFVLIISIILFMHLHLTKSR